MEILNILISLLIFPGLLSLIFFALLADWVDRKIYAHVQGRYGPLYTGKSGVLQPLADFLKLLSKEDITPHGANFFMFNILPLVCFASVCTAAMLLPIGHISYYNSFPGDLLVILYFLGLPTLVYFLAGWHSSNFFSVFGGVRAIIQLFAYEVPFMLAVFTPAILTESFQLNQIGEQEITHPLCFILDVLAFIVGILGLQAKLERIPFDIPEAETEIVGGPLTEYSGKKLAVFHITREIMLWVGSALLACVFFGGFGTGILSGVWYIAKTFAIIFILSIIRSAAGRLRIDQLVNFSWKYLAPLSFVQLLLVIIIKGFALV